MIETNVNPNDNEFEYYRLIGEAYNQHVLHRASLDPKTLDQYVNGTSLFAYVLDGIPQIQKHSHLMDVEHAYAKFVFIKDKAQYKIYSSTCAKLPFNKSENRQAECRLATGYFLVGKAGLFKEVCGINDLQSCSGVSF